MSIHRPVAQADFPLDPVAVSLQAFESASPGQVEGYLFQGAGTLQEFSDALEWTMPLVITAVLLIVVGLSTGPLINNIISLIVPAGF